MSQNPESLLEVDRIDEVLKAPDPPQTVVVVQYRTGRLPWVLLAGVVLLIPLIGYAIYYRANQGLNDRAVWAARAEVKRLEEQKRLEAEQRAPIRSEPPIAPASTSLSTVPAPGAAAPAPGSVAGNSGSDTPKVDPIATKPVESPAASQPSSVAGAAPRPVGATTSPMVAAADARVSPPRPSPRGLDSVAAVKAPADAARSPFDDPDPAATDPAETPFGGTASRTSAIAQPSPGATFPRATPPKLDASPDEIQPGVVAEPSTPTSPAPTSQPIALPAEAPLPSREETERQIREEAAQKNAELAREIEQKQVEDRRMQYEERVRFHQELREALARNGNQAGMVIDQLCQKFDYKSDPASFALALETWKSPKSLAYRIHMIRKLDLPETVILNFLSADLDPLIHTRNGPRNRNELRKKAAQRLLRYPMPPPDEKTRVPAKPGQSAPPPNRRSGIPAAGAAAIPR